VEDPAVLPLDHVEREYIVYALAQCGGNRSLAARRLGIGRNTLLRKLGVLTRPIRRPRRYAQVALASLEARP
jgi:DNA-binding NtrC family response regulator